MAREILLPSSHTPVEAAIDLTGARIGELPVGIRELIRPYEVPATHLPWLAWGLSVDLWRNDWPEEKKRVVTAGSLRFHARKGSRSAISEAIRTMGGDPIRYTVPPAKTFLMPAYTQAERAAFLSLFAQIRLYPYVARGLNNKYAHFTSKAFGRSKAFLGEGTPFDTHSYSRWVRTGKLWDRGVETTLTTRAIGLESVGNFAASAYDEVILPGRPARGLYLNAVPKASMFAFDDFGAVRERVIKVSRSTNYELRLPRETYSTIYPRGELIENRPESVYEQHTGQSGALYLGGGKQFIEGKHLPPTASWKYVFERWYLHDPDRITEARARSIHIGFTRLGMPPYHAEINVRLPGKINKSAAGRFVTGYLIATDKPLISDTREAVNVSRSCRDKVLLDTKTYRSLRLNDRMLIGSARLGQYVKV